MPDKALLLSIRPEYAEKIFAGEKTVELRRTRPRLSKGSLVLVYVSSPTMELVGAFEVDGVIQGKPESLWSKVSQRAGMQREQYDQYYAGAARAYGILIGKAWLFDKSVSLCRLRRKFPGFHPPQSYRYLGDHDIMRLGAAR